MERGDLDVEFSLGAGVFEVHVRSIRRVEYIVLILKGEVKKYWRSSKFGVFVVHMLF